MDTSKFSEGYRKIFEREVKLLEERDPYYKIFSEYVHLYNDGKKDLPLMKPIIEDLKSLNPKEKAEILELFHAKINRKKDKEKYEDVIYYKGMQKHFMGHCI